MADGEVKIHVSADGDLKKIEEAQKKIQELYKAAAAYEAKGMDSAAKSARGDAHSMERDVARFTKERAAAERAVTKEMKEQGALRKAGIGSRGAGRLAQAAEAGREVLSGGNPVGSLMGLGMRSANPAVMIASAVAAVAVGIKGMLDQQADEATMRGMKFDERRGADAYRQRRSAGIFGSSSALISGALDAGEEIDRREKAVPALKEKAREKWYAPSTWTWGGMRKNEGQVELEENDNERIAAGIRRASDLKQAKSKYIKEEGGLELEALRGRSKRSLAGSREAFVAEEAGKAFAKYKEVLKASGDEDMAKEMADLTYKNDLRDRQAQAGAGLVDAKSGGAGIAAAARWAIRATPREEEIGGRLDTLIGVVHSGNQLSQIQNQAK